MSKRTKLGAPRGSRVEQSPFWRQIACILLLTVVLSPACGSRKDDLDDRSSRENEFPVTLSTTGGRVRIEQRPRRVVSLSPTATEILFAIGAGSQVRAVDESSNYPADAPRTQLSGFNPNIEAIAAYSPDLVVYSGGSGDLAAALEKVGVPAIFQPPARSLSDTYRQINELGVATGNIDRANEVVRTMKAEIHEVSESRPRFPRPMTYYHELDQSYFTATSQTFIGEIYGLLGLVNIADEADKDGSGYPQLSAEYIIKADPDFIFLADAKCCGQSAATVAARPGWLQVNAVQAGRTIALDDDVASRWGPRVVEFVRGVADAVKSSQPAPR